MDSCHGVVYYAVVVLRSEQEEIAWSKAVGEALSWEDLGKMRHT